MSTQPYVSVLMPTRQRSDLVMRSVKSVLSLAHDPSSVEIVVAYDEDDAESHALFMSQQWQDLIQNHGARDRVFRTPQWGYSEIHRYFNLMCQETSSDWLLVWNDDAVMVTKDWDLEIPPAGDFIGMLHIECTTYPKLSLFPLFPRAWIELFGEMAACAHVDSWVLDICQAADAIKMTNIQIYHDRYSETGNNNDSTYQGRTWHGKKLYKSQAMRDLRAQWAQRLIAYKQSLEITPHVTPTLA